MSGSELILVALSEMDPVFDMRSDPIFKIWLVTVNENNNIPLRLQYPWPPCCRGGRSTAGAPGNNAPCKIKLILFFLYCDLQIMI